MDESILAVPGMENLLRRRDLPSFIRQARDTKDPTLQFVYEVTASTSRARALILNTCECMELPVLSHVRAAYPTIYAVGPLHALLESFRSSIDPHAIDSASLWSEDRTCLNWLDSQPAGSVVYVSFGSYTVVTREDLVEFWHGLVNSGHRFLWVIRSDLVNENDNDRERDGYVPAELAVATRERGCLVEWAPQEEVLTHPAIGCFLTHSGWNSTLESVVAGVPMICWPFFADQQINSRFVGEVWRIGLDMKDVSSRSTVERMVREAMEGNRAEELKKSATAMAKTAKESVKEGGSSFVDFQRLVEFIKSTGSNAAEEKSK